MKFKNSKYFYELNHINLDFKFGDVFLFDNFIIAEIYEGIHLDWNKTKEFAEKLVEYYGKGKKIGYISNRINSYSIDVQSWIKTEKKYNLVLAAAVVVYNKSSLMNVKIESHFATNAIKDFSSLDEAIEWIKVL